MHMQRLNVRAWALLLVILTLPLISMLIVPFYDTSEPRYAEIARMMAETGDWITPWFSPGLPFWGKPPLSFWAQALSIKAFGFSELAVRLPSWVCLLLTDAILLCGLRTYWGPRLAVRAAIIYSSFALVYLCSGAVLTDPFLALGTSLSLISFAVAAMHGHHLHQAPPAPEGASLPHDIRWWQYGFFIGLAIGLLAKGPLALVLSLAPVAVWLLCNRKAVPILQVLPWGKGIALTALLSLPWYILAEIKTPGFLDYFIIGEHFRRFLDPGWGGDLYGSAHRQAYGTIWIYWLQASFPWGALLLLTLIPGIKRLSSLRQALLAHKTQPLFSYWVASALFTPLFFTFSANILWTYLLPSLAGLSIIIAFMVGENGGHPQPWPKKRHLRSIAAAVPVIVLALSIVTWIKPDIKNTERELVSYVHQQDEAEIPLFYLNKPPFSALYYSGGQVQSIKLDALKNRADSGQPFYLAIPKDEFDVVSNMLGQHEPVLFTNRRYMLVKILPHP